ncbi:hypothetical protein BDA99DRAFT_519317 [Phascolomyces articulosus]|uniref:Uncharacterized protein n=1 Tax=Phascolomyces articulosus TaxID=60185 RepID=A0AAD5PAL5_9FUNG|nr:hypothetical protein BDA99DRAFT_519317 [Phascolomyces articulosus]
MCRCLRSLSLNIGSSITTNILFLAIMWFYTDGTYNVINLIQLSPTILAVSYITNIVLLKWSLSSWSLIKSVSFTSLR